MRSLYLIAWGVNRLILQALWMILEPIGEANLWLKKKALGG